MKITTLGTSHGDSTYCRFNSSTLYEVGDAMYLVDCGSPCDALLCRKGKELSRLRAVFITHMHDDHVGGLTEIVKALQKYAKPGQHTTFYFAEEAAVKPFCEWLRAMHIEPRGDIFTFTATHPGEVYSDDRLTVSAYPTDHIPSAPIKPVTFAYIIEGEGKRLLHTGDLWVDFHDYPEILLEEHFDLLVCEATHYRPERALPRFAESRMDRLIFIHIADEWHGETGEAALLAHYRTLTIPISVAHDGDEFEL